MTVGELIEKLEDFGDHVEVFVLDDSDEQQCEIGEVNTGPSRTTGELVVHIQIR